jgi:hypothetical protein
MKNYDYGPFHHVLVGMVETPMSPLRTQRGYILVGRRFPGLLRRLVDASLVRDVGQNHFKLISETINQQMQELVSKSAPSTCA